MRPRPQYHLRKAFPSPSSAPARPRRSPQNQSPQGLGAAFDALLRFHKLKTIDAPPPPRSATTEAFTHRYCFFLRLFGGSSGSELQLLCCPLQAVMLVKHTGQDVLIFPVSHFSVRVQTAGVRFAPVLQGAKGHVVHDLRNGQCFRPHRQSAEDIKIVPGFGVALR